MPVRRVRPRLVTGTSGTPTGNTIREVSPRGNGRPGRATAPTGADDPHELQDESSPGTDDRVIPGRGVIDRPAPAGSGEAASLPRGGDAALPPSPNFTNEAQPTTRTHEQQPTNNPHETGHRTWTTTTTTSSTTAGSRVSARHAAHRSHGRITAQSAWTASRYDTRATRSASAVEDRHELAGMTRRGIDYLDELDGSPHSVRTAAAWMI